MPRMLRVCLQQTVVTVGQPFGRKAVVAVGGFRKRHFSTTGGGAERGSSHLLIRAERRRSIWNCGRPERAIDSRSDQFALYRALVTSGWRDFREPIL